MRLDQFLKLSRIIKQRSVAKWACDAGRVEMTGRKATAGVRVREGDEIAVSLRDRFIRVRVVEIPTGNVSKERARTLYEILEERDVPNSSSRAGPVSASEAGSGARIRPRIVVTMGDPAGVGIDVALAALAPSRIRDAADVRVVGSRSAIERRARLLSIPLEADVIDTGDADSEPGLSTESGAKAAVRSIEAAARMCLAGEADAMVTGPVSKAAICDAGIDFSGHTEFLAALAGAATVVMTFVSGARRIALATTHHALSEVARIISSELIVSKLLVLSAGLDDWLGVREPRIAVAALNPHAGEDGRLGDEESRIIAPAIETSVEAGVLAEGPFPADAIFRGFGAPGGAAGASRFDAVLAMYHDQGTIPAKMSGEPTVNLTLGLPIVRTSVDHGTAFELAGSGAADCSSMAAALELAISISRRRAGASTRTGA